jgi:sporulation protein YlmC with PRC-barrel domain
MKLSDLRHKKIRTPEGDELGRIQEIHCDGGRVVALTYGPSGFLERWGGKSGRRIAWDAVKSIGRGAVIVAPRS